MMNRANYIREVAKRCGFTKKDVEAVMDKMKEVIYEVVGNNDTVKVFDSLAFTGVYVDERMGRNPSTGEPVAIPAHTLIKTKIGKAFKDAVRYNTVKE